MYFIVAACNRFFHIVLDYHFLESKFCSTFYYMVCLDPTQLKNQVNADDIFVVTNLVLIDQGHRTDLGAEQ